MQNLQESTCVFLWILQNFFKNSYFEEHLWTTASGEDSFDQHQYFSLDFRCVKVVLFRLNLFASFLFPPTDFHLTKYRASFSITIVHEINVTNSLIVLYWNSMLKIKKRVKLLLWPRHIELQWKTIVFSIRAR